MNILITGASGMVGQYLAEQAPALGYHVAGLPRTSRSETIPRWQPTSGEIRLPEPNPYDAVIHLAGRSIACRWTQSNKRQISESRIQGTTLLARALAAAHPKPRVLISASATGYYGNRGDNCLDETSASGSGFLAEVAQAWENATEEAADAGIRVVRLRLGIVLSPRGGALSQMLPVFRCGLGGRVGHGRQYWSWITLEDLSRAIFFCLGENSTAGAINATAPQPVTNQEFTQHLGRALHRPTPLPVPAFLAKLALGQMAEEALLASTRVKPKRLLAAGFEFHHPDLPSAFRAML